MKYHVDNPFESPVVLSLCTGMRGLERGIERAFDRYGRNTDTVKNGTTLHENRNRISVAVYVEIEAFIIYNLVKQMEQGVLDPVPVWTDLKTFPAQFFRGKIHIITGGYPCQPFSVAGQQKGTEDPRHLWPHIEHITEIIRPPIVFFENVANHLNLGYREVRHSLEAMGYSVKEGIYSAEEVGAPHERKRLFILAVANAYVDGARRFAGNILGQGREIEGTAQGKNRQWSGDEHRNVGEKMVDPSFKSLEGRDKFGRLWDESIGTSKELVNTPSLREREQANETDAITIERTTRGEFSDAGDEELANTDNQGLQGRISGELQECADEFFIRQGDSQAWPAGQGNFQHEWEHPRTVKPGVGCTINGYNFRTDLLRMYGNGVVEQTAELAFIDLLNKHLK